MGYLRGGWETIMAEIPTGEKPTKQIQALERNDFKQKQFQEKMSASEEKYHEIFNNATIGIGIADQMGQIIEYNNAILKPGNYDRDDISKIANISELYYNPVDRIKLLNLAKDQGFIDEAQVQFRRKDGTPYDTLFSLKPITLDGKSCWQAMIQDITERKNIEKALRESKHKLNTHLQNTPVGAISWDLNFRTTEWNPAAEAIFGYSKEETLGKHVADLILPSNLKELVEGIFQDILSEKGGKHSINGNITKDGRRIICDWYNTALKDANGRNIGMASLVNDITESLQTEKALRESENRFRDVSLSMADWIWETNSETKFTYISQGIKDVLGYAPEELIGKTPFDLMPEDESVRVKEIVSKIVSKSENIKDLENWNVDKAGHRLFMLTSGIPILDNEGKTRGYRGVNKNITAQIKLETQLQQAQKMESIGTLAGGIAHDFNNILFPIMGHTEMLLEDIPEDSPFRDSLNKIYSGTLRAKDLVKQILTFSRQEKSELNLMKMQPIIKETLKLIRSTIPSTIEIKHDIQTDCGVVKADPTQIHQIVMNLATNAYHAMEKTGGELKVSLKNVELGNYDVITPDMIPGEYVCLTVSDTGTGMDKDLTEKIFDPFFTTKAIGKGTGMGLSVIHGIVIRMGGAVQVNSKPGKGTQFYVYLPVEKSLSEEQLTHSNVEIQIGTEHILLIDDEEAILTMGKKLLERLGYQVTSQISSVEALEVFRANSNKFDLVITDMAMPNMSGDKLSAELVKINPDIPVLLCTGYSEIMSEEKAFSMGIKGFLIKPIVLKDLSQKIREVLDGNKA